MKLEGFNPDDAIFRLELEMKFGGQVHTLRITSPALQLRSQDDVRTIRDQFIMSFSEKSRQIALYPEGGIETQHLIASTPDRLARRSIFHLAAHLRGNWSPRALSRGKGTHSGRIQRLHQTPS